MLYNYLKKKIFLNKHKEIEELNDEFLLQQFKEELSTELSVNKDNIKEKEEK